MSHHALSPIINLQRPLSQNEASFATALTPSIMSLSTSRLPSSSSSLQHASQTSAFRARGQATAHLRLLFPALRSISLRATDATVHRRLHTSDHTRLRQPLEIANARGNYLLPYILHTIVTFHNALRFNPVMQPLVWAANALCIVLCKPTPRLPDRFLAANEAGMASLVLSFPRIFRSRRGNP
ncbi:hypothetical protein L226DRAFT_169937 [Lentinus tigrinus ALCF2SS1-7]|uniref:Uncharacterized protein n=1 Tax=Lentinus tigrinus ALCF2SS1-6 TaxID=1328759 RepID=A0A5C2S059_9APHY|nr:hypothetical protein L227DRAFT_251826 [Lentinus tigrinus ALCF2SS1-6]RPD71551.1 hypothetical protein L226DRAFT_169937 [Lentinus tigrinus ALCF2SS1-7]